MVSLIAQYAQFDWDSGSRMRSTFAPPVFDPGFTMAQDWATRFAQYDMNHNDRAFYTPGCVLDGSCPVNFRDQMPGGGDMPAGSAQGARGGG
jgi:hypothetical protein